MAARRRARPRDAALVGHAGRRRGADVRHHRDHRPPRVAERHRRLAVGHRRRVRRGRRAGRLRLRRHRSWNDDGTPYDGSWPPRIVHERRGARARRERALPPRRRARHGRRARRVHVRRRHARGRRRSGRQLGVGVHIHVGEDASTPTPARACNRWPATTGCSCTACTSIATARHDRPQPPQQHEQRRRLRAPGGTDQPHRARHRRHRRRHARRVPPRLRAPARGRRDRHPRHRVVVARARATHWCPRPATTRCAGTTTMPTRRGTSRSPPASARSTSPSTARSCCATASRRVSTWPRCGRRRPSRRRACSPHWTITLNSRREGAP